MSRFSSDFLPFDGNSINDTTGEVAPVTRIFMQVPPEYRENPEADEYLSEILEEVVGQYRGKTRSWLQKFRMEKGVSILETYVRHQKVDDYVSVEYINQWGREYFSVYVGEGLIRKIKEKLDPLCLLVLHSGNRLAAIRMEDVYAGSFDPIYEAEGRSDWQEKEVNAQEAMSPTSSVATALGLHFITDFTVYKTTEGFNGLGDQSSILNGHGDAKSAKFYRTNETWEFDPDTKHMVQIAVAQLSPTAVSSNGEFKESKIDDQQSGPENYGDKTTTYYIMETELGGNERKYDPPIIIEKVKVETAKRDKTWTRQILSFDVAPDAPGCDGNEYCNPVYTPEEGHNNAYSTTYDGEVIASSSNVQIGVDSVGTPAWIRTVTDVYGPVSFDILLIFSDDGTGNPIVLWGWAVSSGGTSVSHGPVYSESQPQGSTTYYTVGWNNGILSAEDNASNVVSSQFDFFYPDRKQDWIDAYNAAYCGAHHISTTVSYEGPFSSDPVPKFKSVGNAKDITPYFFPYAVGGKTYCEIHDGDANTYTYESPYDEISSGENQKTFRGWLNLHNGKILIQGAYLEGSDNEKSYVLYFDGKKQEKVGDIQLADISTMYIDMPLSWIKKWPKP